MTGSNKGSATVAVVGGGLIGISWSALFTTHGFDVRLNPPHLIPLVELFGSDPARLDAAWSFYRSVGRNPVRMKRDAVGHIANRLSSALWREAVNMVAEGIGEEAHGREIAELEGLRDQALIAVQRVLQGKRL